MPTARAAIALGAVAALFGAGRLFGIDELLVIGIGILAVFVLAVALTPRPRLILTQQIRPSQIHVGNAATLEIDVQGTQFAPWTTEVAMRLPTGSTAMGAPVISHSQSALIYDLPTAARGKVEFRSPRVITEDALGLWRRTSPGGDDIAAWILPKVERLSDRAFLELAQGGWSHSRPVHDDEVVGVRAYVAGDDPRRINWLHSARTDDLIVRDQLSQIREQRLDVFLDRRASVFSADSFETAVSIAASLVFNALKCNISMTLHGTGTKHTIMSADLQEGALRDLALVNKAGTDSLIAAINAAESTNSAVIISSGAMAQSELIQLTVMASQRPMTLLRVPPFGGEAVLSAGALRVVDVNSNELQSALEPN